VDSAKARRPAALRLVERLLTLTGRNYSVSPDIPASYLFGEVWIRAVQATRGIIRFRELVFVGAGVSVRGKRQMRLARGISIGDGSRIDSRGRSGLNMAPGSRLGRNGIITMTSHLSLLGNGVTIGRNSGVGDFFHIGASGGVTIGNDVIVGPYLLVHSQEHVYDNSDKPIRVQGTRQAPVVVGNDCWIGSRVTLLAGAEIGPRTVVAAGAVVRGKHDGNEILAGVPARSIKKI
jgi:acetyltransferase-like isoleucine patch superfamily enzyme